MQIYYISKITHQKRRDHPFIERSKTTEKGVGLGIGGNRESEGVEQNLKRGGKQYRRGVFIK